MVPHTAQQSIEDSTLNSLGCKGTRSCRRKIKERGLELQHSDALCTPNAHTHICWVSCIFRPRAAADAAQSGARVASCVRLGGSKPHGHGRTRRDRLSCNLLSGRLIPGAWGGPLGPGPGNQQKELAPTSKKARPRRRRAAAAGGAGTEPRTKGSKNMKTGVGGARPPTPSLGNAYQWPPATRAGCRAVASSGHCTLRHRLALTFGRGSEPAARRTPARSRAAEGPHPSISQASTSGGLAGRPGG